MKKNSNLSESLRYSKGSSKRVFVAIGTYIKQSERCQINKLMVYLILKKEKAKAKP
jgi:hypothetical protein